MLKFKLIGLALILKSFLINTFHSTPEEFERNRGAFKKISLGRMPEMLESSGLEIYNDSLLITHQDSGGESALFIVNYNAEIKDTIHLELRNYDWEDIAQDDKGNLYIGDFGNNLNQRKKQFIYKYDQSTGEIGKIQFSLADQKAYPPGKKEMNFDIEAMCWKGNELHLFSKNRGLKCVKHYVLPDQPGEYVAQPIESVYLPNQVTGADINPGGDMLVLSSYGRIYTFKISAGNRFFEKPYKMIRFTRGAQMEGVVYINETDFVVSNETGKLFLFRSK
ncbi:hypothetical protein C900_05508 [Fulvivirga imtechensis AK7]|uniref:Periplasmic ATP/GTP-binding protein n=1 Tax=Fulvivirga imtechensis AK7 TaxID=1237149 RepID=L8JNL5_9BACT|nr:hypothetical protein [Fulvivirga imtechensis]ELR69119.1 hypothetical protein C900_05508 [Fulvivirga imtechensis AK7]